MMTPWTPKLELELRRLWLRGDSAQEIGHAIGMSKNAVIGKAHRMLLPARPSPLYGGRARMPA